MATYEMTIKVEIPENFGEFQVLEKEVVKATREAGRGILRKIFLDYQDWTIGKKSVQKHDQREKKFETLLGVIDPSTQTRPLGAEIKKKDHPERA